MIGSSRIRSVKQLLLVGIGGGIGAIARWKLGGLILHHTTEWRFPLATFIVNFAGCLVGGILAGLVAKRDLFAADTRVFLFTGLLGGFTTFSAFSLETVYLLRRKDIAVALGYVLLSVVGGIAAFWIALSSMHRK